jgi:hypothetical protein
VHLPMRGRHAASPTAAASVAQVPTVEGMIYEIRSTDRVPEQTPSDLGQGRVLVRKQGMHHEHEREIRLSREQRSSRRSRLLSWQT